MCNIKFAASIRRKEFSSLFFPWLLSLLFFSLEITSLGTKANPLLS